MDISLTPLQAFHAMQHFLENYFEVTASDSFGVLLSSMQFLEDGGTADPALWQEWIVILNSQERLTPLQAFDKMRIFLENYYKQNVSKDVERMLQDIKTSKSNTVANQYVWNRWMACIFTELR